MLKSLLVFAAIGLGVSFLVWFAFFGSVSFQVWRQNRRLEKRGAVSPRNIALPDEDFYSRNDPPWVRPRKVVDSRSSRQGLADFNLLMRRLELVEERPMRPGDWEAPKLYVDHETGQRWLCTLEEVGFNQWYELNPVEAPASGKTEN